MNRPYKQSHRQYELRKFGKKIILKQNQPNRFESKLTGAQIGQSGNLRTVGST